MQELETAEQERYQIKDDTNANWAFHKLKELSDQLDELKEQKKIYDQQNQEWFNHESNKIMNDKDFFENLIEEYRLTKPDGRVNVPAGKTIVRHSKSFKRDDNELLNYIKANHIEEAVETKVKWSELKKNLTIHDDKMIDDNGQVVPGVTVEENENVSYKFN